MELSKQVTGRLKPGVMAREAAAPGLWTLYHPAMDLRGTLSVERSAPGRLAVVDLDADDRLWNGGRLDWMRYYAAQNFRAHRDGRAANLEVNSLCQYACRHCFQPLMPAHRAESTPAPEALRLAADRLREAGVREITITGGDIFLHPDIWNLLDDLFQRAPEVTLRLPINGAGLDPDDAATKNRLRRLRGRRILAKCDFFGHTAPLHDDFTRVAGSFDRTLRIVQMLQEMDVACVPAAQLTRANFENRFDLIVFLDNLTDDRFLVGSLLYPSAQRSAEESSALRLTAMQYDELMEETYFAPLAAEYHSWEPPCAGDCQFPVISASGAVWGCSFLKDRCEECLDPAAKPPSLDERIVAWRTRARAAPETRECPACPARLTCRKCPSFLHAGQMGEEYCLPSRRAFARLADAVRRAWQEGFQFVHAGIAEQTAEYLRGKAP